MTSQFEKFQLSEHVLPTDSQLLTIFSETKPVTILFDKEKIISVLIKMESIKQLYPNEDVKDVFSNVYSGDLIFKPTVQKDENNPSKDSVYFQPMVFVPLHRGQKMHPGHKKFYNRA